MRIRPKLAMLFAGIGVLAVTVTSAVNYIMAEASLKVAVADQLVGLRSSKSLHVETEFRDLRRSLEVEASDDTVAQAFLAFRDSTTKLGNPTDDSQLKNWYLKHYQDRAVDAFIPRDPAGRKLQELCLLAAHAPGKAVALPESAANSPYGKAHQAYHQTLDDFRTAFNLNDVMLCDPATGRIVYSSAKEPDLGNSVLESPLASTGLALAVRMASSGRFFMADFTPYLPSNNAPTSFMAAPILQNKKVIGVLIAQIGVDDVDKIVSGGGNWAREGLGETGETILFGADGLMRSNSRYATTEPADLLADLKANGTPKAELDGISRTKSTVLRVQLPSEITNDALRGSEGFLETTSYRGKPVVAAYAPMIVAGVRWGIVCERDQSEAYESLRNLRATSLYSGLGMFLITILISYLVSGSFTQPLTKLSDAAHRLAVGELGVRVDLKTQDEYGELGRTFDHMVEAQEKFDDVADAIRRNIVHDLKTPLTVIKGMAETLQDPGIAGEPELLGEMVGAISQQSDRLLDDLQDILAPITDHYQPDKERFDLATLVETSVQTERVTGRAASHTIVVEGTGEPFTVFADRRKIRRVIENLLSNAVKYSPGTDKKVVVHLSANDGFALIAVRDEGLGMTTDQLIQVMDTGGRVAEHARMGIEGTGLGLDSVKLILEAHGGELRAKSAPGVGSTFTAVLPRGV